MPDQKIIQHWLIHEIKTIEGWMAKKMPAFTGKDFNLLEEQINDTQSFLGIKEEHLLGDREVFTLLEYLKEEFPDFSVSEIGHAVKMAVAGRLYGEDKNGQSKQVDAQHYNEFGALYLTKILKAYRIFRGSIISKYDQGEKKLLIAETTKEPEPLTEEKKRENMISFALITFENFKTDLPVGGLDRVYDFLAKEKKINLTNEEKVKYEVAAKDEISRAAKKGGPAKNIFDTMMGNAFNDGTIVAKAKSNAVKAYFTQLLKADKELKAEFVKPLKSDC